MRQGRPGVNARPPTLATGYVAGPPAARPSPIRSLSPSPDPTLPGEIHQALGDNVEVHPAADAEAARHAVERHDVVAVLSTDGPDQLRLEIAGAVGTSTTSVVNNLVGAYAHGAGKHVTTED